MSTPQRLGALSRKVLARRRRVEVPPNTLATVAPTFLDDRNEDDTTEKDYRFHHLLNVDVKQQRTIKKNDWRDEGGEDRHDDDGTHRFDHVVRGSSRNWHSGGRIPLLVPDDTSIRTSWLQLQTCRTMVSQPTFISFSPSATTTTTTTTKDNTSTNSNSSSTINDKDSTQNKVLSPEQRQSMERNVSKFKLLMRQYGAVFLGTYLSAYFFTLGSLFVAVHWGFLEPSTIDFSGDVGGGGEVGTTVEEAGHASSTTATDTATTTTTKSRPPSGGGHEALVHLLQKYDWTRPYADRVAANPALLNLGIAWVATKFTEPLRLGFTVFATPRIARFLGKAPPKKEEEEAEENGGAK